LMRNLEALPPLAGAMSSDDPDARTWAEALLAGFRWDQCARERVRFACRCSRDRVLAVLASLPREDLVDIVDAAKPVETTCEFCRQIFRVAPTELGGLLSRPHRADPSVEIVAARSTRGRRERRRCNAGSAATWTRCIGRRRTNAAGPRRHKTSRQSCA